MDSSDESSRRGVEEVDLEAPDLGDDNFQVRERALLAKLEASKAGGASKAEGAGAAPGIPLAQLAQPKARDHDLKSDIDQIRERVLGIKRAQLDAVDLSPEEQMRATAGLRAEFQSDLDTDTAALAELEDPDLIEHMASARRVLSSYEVKIKNLPSQGDINLKFTDTMAALSALVRGLEDHKRTSNDAAAMAEKRAEALATIRVRGAARNAPPSPFRALPEGADEYFRFFEKEAEKTARESGETAQVLAEVRNEIFRLRRDVEFVGDSYLRLVQALDAERQCHRELLRDGARAAAARTAAAR